MQYQPDIKVIFCFQRAIYLFDKWDNHLCMDKFLKISYQVLEDTCIAPVYVTSIYRNNIQIDVAFFTMLFP